MRRRHGAWRSRVDRRAAPLRRCPPPPEDDDDDVTIDADHDLIAELRASRPRRAECAPPLIRPGATAATTAAPVADHARRAGRTGTLAADRAPPCRSPAGTPAGAGPAPDRTVADDRVRRAARPRRCLRPARPAWRRGRSPLDRADIGHVGDERHRRRHPTVDDEGADDDRRRHHDHRRARPPRRHRRPPSPRRSAPAGP